MKSNENMIKITLFFTHQHIESELELKDKNVVVIDVLRTTSTMSVGLSNGAKEIIPTEDVATAGMIGRNSMGQSLLCGERNGKIIQGFNLGNSVSEYSKTNVDGKTLIFNSTNGTTAILKAKFSKTCTILSFLNISRVVDFISKMGEDFIIVCAGKEGEFSLEDTVCAGMLINKLLSKNKKKEYNLTDSALGASKLFSVYSKNISDMMSDSEHGKYLVSIGFRQDLEDCSKIDMCSCLPVMRNGVIKLLESFESDPKLTMKRVVQKSN